MSFEHYTDLLTKCLSALDKHIDEKLSDIQKVNALFKGIKTQDMELLASKAIISQQYPRDLDAACAYFSKEVARLHGGAQLENQRKNCKRRISVLAGTVDMAEVEAAIAAVHEAGDTGGGHQGGGGLGYQDKQTEINGINVADLTQSFTDDEWT